jgi:hypothetical protein
MQGTTLKHALRVYQDKYSQAIRIESRALRGRNQNIPIWVAFLPPGLKARGWIRAIAPRQVELRFLQQHVFVTGYVPTLGRDRKRFLIDFENSDGMFYNRQMKAQRIMTNDNVSADAQDFIQVMKDYLVD